MLADGETEAQRLQGAELQAEAGGPDSSAGTLGQVTCFRGGAAKAGGKSRAGGCDRTHRGGAGVSQALPKGFPTLVLATASALLA